MKGLKRVMALVFAMVLTLSMNAFVFAADEIVLDGDSGASSFIGDFSAKGGEYKYLGFVTTKEATSDYKYLELTYSGNISCLRIEFNREDDSNEGPYWFNPDGQTLYFKTVDGSEIPLETDKDTTITIDLAATGIDIGEFRGMHLHYLDPNMQEGSFSIKNAKLLTSVDGAKGGSGNKKSSTNNGGDDEETTKGSASQVGGSNGTGAGTAGTAGGSTNAPSTGSVTYPIAIAAGGIVVAVASFVISGKLKEED